jgi:hypothetical protein
MSDELANGAATEIRLVIPTANDHIRFARLMASAVAARLGFDYDTIEDLRIAVSELCTVVTEGIPRGELTLTISGDSAGVRITGRAPLTPGSPPPEAPGELSRQILDAVADEHTFELASGNVTFTLLRRVVSPLSNE